MHRRFPSKVICIRVREVPCLARHHTRSANILVHLHIHHLSPPTMKRTFASATREVSPPPSSKRQNTTKSTGLFPVLDSPFIPLPHNPPFATPPPCQALLLPFFANIVAINSFFTPLNQKKSSPTKISWDVRHESLLVGKYRPQDFRPKPTHIAAFDLVPPTSFPQSLPRSLSSPLFERIDI
jgi:hypothetical protein